MAEKPPSLTQAQVRVRVRACVCACVCMCVSCAVTLALAHCFRCFTFCANEFFDHVLLHTTDEFYVTLPKKEQGMFPDLDMQTLLMSRKQRHAQQQQQQQQGAVTSSSSTDNVSSSDGQRLQARPLIEVLSSQGVCVCACVCACVCVCVRACVRLLFFYISV